jgi:hypothetical protein
MCEEFGYQIFGLNAARVYGIDAEAMKKAGRNDDLAWCRQAVDEYRKTQFPGVR